MEIINIVLKKECLESVIIEGWHLMHPNQKLDSVLSLQALNLKGNFKIYLSVSTILLDTGKAH